MHRRFKSRGFRRRGCDHTFVCLELFNLTCTLGILFDRIHIGQAGQGRSIRAASPLGTSYASTTRTNRRKW
eukprot:6105565-Amphidinium_carterae.1